MPEAVTPSPQGEGRPVAAVGVIGSAQPNRDGTVARTEAVDPTALPPADAIVPVPSGGDQGDPAAIQTMASEPHVVRMTRGPPGAASPCSSGGGEVPGEVILRREGHPMILRYRRPPICRSQGRSQRCPCDEWGSCPPCSAARRSRGSRPPSPGRRMHNRRASTAASRAGGPDHRVAVAPIQQAVRDTRSTTSTAGVSHAPVAAAGVSKNRVPNDLRRCAADGREQAP